jgi:ABC-type protease/lipase transport system fused ATPase/permease subunit
MQKSTPRIEKLLAEAENQVSIEEAPVEVKNQIKEFQKIMVKTMFFMKFIANVFLILSVLYIFLIYTNVVQTNYANAIINGCLFIFCLFQFADTYYKVRLYETSKNNMVYNNQEQRKSNEGG